MSIRNGDKARTNAQRRKRIVQRMKTRAIRAGMTNREEAAAPPSRAKKSAKQTTTE